MNGMLWAPMRRLMAKARKKREADIKALRNSEASTNQLKTPSASPPRTLSTAPAFGELPVASPQFFDEHLDPVRPLQTGLPPGGQWTELSPHTVPISNMGNYFPASSQLQLEEQFQQHDHVPSRPWILDDSALIDLDMNGVNGLDGWNEMANYFQMELDPTVAPDARWAGYGGGLGSWL